MPEILVILLRDRAHRLIFPLMLHHSRLSEVFSALAVHDGFGTGHMVIAPFLEIEGLNQVLAAFPSVDAQGWDHVEIQSKLGRQLSHRKRTRSDLQNLPQPIQALIDQLHSVPFIDILERATGISGLTPDPMLHGGALHHYLPGAILSPHIDANVHPVTGLHRRLNLILYLNENWDTSWGGALEIWSTDGQTRLRSISPTCNQCLIMATTPDAYHAIEDIRCPEGQTRKSVMVRYYTKDRPERERRAPHRALWAEEGKK